MLDRLKELQVTRHRYGSGKELRAALSDPALRAEIAALSRRYLHRTVTGCGDCYMDAYFALLALDTDRIMEKEQCKFALKAGVLLSDCVNYDVSLNMTNANISDSLALYHLSTNPNCRGKFSRLPENVDEMIEEYRATGKETGTDTAPKRKRRKPKIQDGAL